MDHLLGGREREKRERERERERERTAKANGRKYPTTELSHSGGKMGVI